MDYKEAYVREVGQRLPEKMRDDVQNEIRSMIEDTLEDRSQSAGRPADEEMLLDVLRKLGPPEKMAASYLPPRYVIGPELYPTFVTVLRIVLTVIIILGAVGLGLSLGAGEYLTAEAYEAIGSAAGELMGSIVSAIGSVMLVFWIIQVLNPNIRISHDEWDPRKLKPIVDEDRIKIAEPVAGIIFNTLILMVLYLYPEWLGIISFSGGEVVRAPLFTGAFFSYLPWFTLVLVLEVVKDSLLIGSARWTPVARWMAIGGAALTVVVGIMLLTGPAILALDPAAINRLGWGSITAGTAERISEALNQAARIGIGIIIAFQFIEIGKQLYRLYGSRLPIVQVNH